jgi:hypothetical protein
MIKRLSEDITRTNLPKNIDLFDDWEVLGRKVLSLRLTTNKIDDPILKNYINILEKHFDVINDYIERRYYKN